MAYLILVVGGYQDIQSRISLPIVSGRDQNKDQYIYFKWQARRRLPTSLHAS